MFYLNSEFICNQLSLVLPLWDLGEKTTACRKQRFNHLGQRMVWQPRKTWATQVEFFSSILPIAWGHTPIFAWFTPSLMHSKWLQVIAFWGGYRFTWFGALSQHNWTLPYQSLKFKVVYSYFGRISCVYPGLNFTFRMGSTPSFCGHCNKFLTSAIIK